MLGAQVLSFCLHHCSVVVVSASCGISSTRDLFTRKIFRSVKLERLRVRDRKSNALSEALGWSMGRRSYSPDSEASEKGRYLEYSEDDEGIGRQDRHYRRIKHHGPEQQGRKSSKKSNQAGWFFRFVEVLNWATFDRKKDQRTTKRASTRRKQPVKKARKSSRITVAFQVFTFGLLCLYVVAYVSRRRQLPKTKRIYSVPVGSSGQKRSIHERDQEENQIHFSAASDPKQSHISSRETHPPGGRSSVLGRREKFQESATASDSSMNSSADEREMHTWRARQKTSTEIASGRKRASDEELETEEKAYSSELASDRVQSHEEERESTGKAYSDEHPMSRTVKNLQVPGDLGRPDDENIKKYYRKLAKAYLATFTHGIYRHMFFDVLRRRTYALTPPGANKGVQSMMFQIIDNKVYLMDPYEVPKNSKPFYRTRINEIIWLLSRLATSGRLKNTEFMVSIHDCVQTVNKPHPYRGATYQESIPAFTIVSCNFSDNIPFPMWEGDRSRGGGFGGWDAQMQEYATNSQQPWSKKDSRAVFRGGNRPSMYFRNKTDAQHECDRVGRTRLLYLAESNPHELDVSVGGSCGATHHYLQRMDDTTQQQFKYVVYAEGNCFWADRLNKQVFGPSMIIKQETPCGQFWEPLLRPMTHYVPTDFFFNDLVDKIKWARDNDRAVQDIIRNANEFANSFLTLKGIEFYVEVLLAEYTALLVEPDVKLERGAIDVTHKRV